MLLPCFVQASKVDDCCYITIMEAPLLSLECDKVGPDPEPKQRWRLRMKSNTHQDDEGEEDECEAEEEEEEEVEPIAVGHAKAKAKGKAQAKTQAKLSKRKALFERPSSDEVVDDEGVMRKLQEG